VYGSRNGARDLGLATDQTPVNPCEVYGAHKARAERLLHDSSLDWVVLRLGGIIAPDLFTKVDRASVFMQQIIPSDNRIHSIWVDDAATAFVRAVDADVFRRTLLVAGDASHRLRQDEFNGQMFTIAGMGRPTPYGGRPGNPDDDGAWFMTEWMDTEPTFEALDFRPLTMAQTILVARRELSPLRGLLRPFGALAKAGISMTSPYRRAPGPYRPVAPRRAALRHGGRQARLGLFTRPLQHSAVSGRTYQSRVLVMEVATTR
jgi:nucleoside-diphosphate-sugar epimerase